MTEPADTRIRDFEVSDAERLRQLISATLDKSFLSFYPQQTINFFKALYSSERILERSRKGKTIVLEKNGDIVGTGSFLSGEISGVFVTPAFQHQGYGKKLMLELERIAHAFNYPKVSLSVTLPSREFCEGLGYRITKECSIEVKNGKRLYYWTASKELRMQKSGVGSQASE